MRRHRRLAVLSRAAERRISRLSRLAVDLRYPSEPASDRVATYIAIEAMNAWTVFIREYYIAATILKAVDSSGFRPFAGLYNSEADALMHAIRAADPRRHRVITRAGRPPRWHDEPVWYKPQVFTGVLRSVGFANLPAVSSALAVRSDVFLSLPTLRNFYAHRSKDTVAKLAPVVRRHSLAPNSRAGDIMGYIPPGGAANLTEIWLDDIRTAMLALS